MRWWAFETENCLPALTQNPCVCPDKDRKMMGEGLPLKWVGQFKLRPPELQVGKVVQEEVQEIYGFSLHLAKATVEGNQLIADNLCCRF